MHRPEIKFSESCNVARPSALRCALVTWACVAAVLHAGCTREEQKVLRDDTPAPTQDSPNPAPSAERNNPAAPDSENTWNVRFKNVGQHCADLKPIEFVREKNILIMRAQWNERAGGDCPCRGGVLRYNVTRRYGSGERTDVHSTAGGVIAHRKGSSAVDLLLSASLTPPDPGYAVPMTVDLRCEADARTTGTTNAPTVPALVKKSYCYRKPKIFRGNAPALSVAPRHPAPTKVCDLQVIVAQASGWSGQSVLWAQVADPRIVPGLLIPTGVDPALQVGAVSIREATVRENRVLVSAESSQ